MRKPKDKHGYDLREGDMLCSKDAGIKGKQLQASEPYEHRGIEQKYWVA